MINQEDEVQRADAPAGTSAPPQVLVVNKPQDKPMRKRSLSQAELYVSDGQANNATTPILLALRIVRNSLRLWQKGRCQHVSFR